jgi:hypothetical protein
LSLKILTERICPNWIIGILQIGEGWGPTGKEGNEVSEYGQRRGVRVTVWGVRWEKEGNADRWCLDDCGVGMLKHWPVRIAHSSDQDLLPVHTATDPSMRIVLDDEKEEERREVMVGEEDRLVWSNRWSSLFFLVAVAAVP